MIKLIELVEKKLSTSNFTTIKNGDAICFINSTMFDLSELKYLDFNSNYNCHRNFGKNNPFNAHNRSTIEVTQDLGILDGQNRVQMYLELKKEGKELPVFDVIVRYFDSKEAAFDYTLMLNKDRTKTTLDKNQMKSRIGSKIHTSVLNFCNLHSDLKKGSEQFVDMGWALAGYGEQEMRHPECIKDDDPYIERKLNNGYDAFLILKKRIGEKNSIYFTAQKRAFARLAGQRWNDIIKLNNCLKRGSWFKKDVLEENKGNNIKWNAFINSLIGSATTKGW